MLEGFACPPGSKTFGERHSLDYCLRDCQDPCVSGPLLKAIFDADRGNYHQGAYLSASLLSGGGCARKTILERQHPFYEYPVNRWWSFRGTIGHALIEAAGDMEQYGWMQELRMTVPLEFDLPAPVFDENGVFTGAYDPTRKLTVMLSGTTDALNVLRGELHDYKSMADVKSEEMVSGKVWSKEPRTFSKNLEDKWVWQTNIYRWLVAHTPVPEEWREMFDLQGEYLPAPERLVIQGFSMMYLPRTGTASEIKIQEGRRKVRAIFEVEDVPVLPLEEIEAYIRPKALAWYRYLVLGEYPPVIEEKNKWLCGFCPFNGERIDGERCFPDKERYELAKAAA